MTQMFGWHPRTCLAAILRACLFLSIFIITESGVSAREVLVSAVSKKESRGPSLDILEHIARRLNARLVLHDAPFKRRLHMIKNGTVDLLPGLVKRPEREAFIRFIHPPYKNRSDTVFLVPKTGTRPIRTYTDLYGLTLGTTLGARYFPRFDTDTSLAKEAVPRMEMNLKKLVFGRLDAVILPEGAYVDLLRKMDLSEKLDLAPYRFSSEKQIFVGISKKSNILIKFPDIEVVLSTMMETGEIRQVFADYFIRQGLPVPAI